MLDHAQLPTGPIRPLRRHEYEQLAELGAFDPAERIELLEGVIYQMSPIGRRHGLAVGRLARRLGAAIDATWDIIPQSSFEATAWSMPEPDIAVFARANRTPWSSSIDRHATASTRRSASRARASA